MTKNITRFKKDFERLVSEGMMLELAMKRDIDREAFKKYIHALLDEKQAAAFIEKLPHFSTGYEKWYSESLVMLRQLLPDRVGNFISFYEKPKARKELQYGNYVVQDYLQGLQTTQHGVVKVGPDAALSQFAQQLAIVKAAEARFESSLFEIRQLVQADLFDNELEKAQELSKHKFLREAGIVAGVVLEGHLQQVCNDRAIKVAKKDPAIGDLNELLKANGVIDVPQWRFITRLGDIRNICGHRKQAEPTKEQVTDLIEGTSKVLKTVA